MINHRIGLIQYVISLIWREKISEDYRRTRQFQRAVTVRAIKQDDRYYFE